MTAVPVEVEWFVRGVASAQPGRHVTVRSPKFGLAILAVDTGLPNGAEFTMVPVAITAKEQATADWVVEMCDAVVAMGEAARRRHPSSGGEL